MRPIVLVRCSPGTPADYLSHYAMHFDTVEADTTHYGVPSPDRVLGWAAKTPPGFLISSKMPRTCFLGDGARNLTGRRWRWSLV